MSEIYVPVISGGFDPIHSGHIELIKGANRLGTTGVVVLLNSDDWLIRKKGKAFMPFEERQNILSHMSNVSFIMRFDDSDGTCIQGLEKLKLMYPKNKFIFCNGGDRDGSNIPETSVKDIEFAFGVGGDNKKNSSSWILEKYYEKTRKFHRAWGYYTILWEGEHNGLKTKVKELVVLPYSKLSFQRHQHRTELWQCVRGKGSIVRSSNEEGWWKTTTDFLPGSMSIIEEKEWHQLVNDEGDPLTIIEIQYGSDCDEEDIERME